MSSVMRCIVKGGSVVKDERADVIRFVISSAELRSSDGVTVGGTRSSCSVVSKDSRRFYHG